MASYSVCDVSKPSFFHTSLEIYTLAQKHQYLSRTIMQVYAGTRLSVTQLIPGGGSSENSENSPNSTILTDADNIPACLIQDDRYSSYAIPKFIICILLFPIKSAIFFCLALISFIIQKISVIGLSRTDLLDSVESRPVKVFAMWRRMLLALTRVCCRINLFLASFYYIKVKGRRDPNTSILVSNHVSYMDIMFMLWHVNPAMTAKKSVLNIPIVCDYLRCSQSLTVDRDDRDSRSRMQKEIIRRANLPEKDRFLPICIFPEGTTTNGKALLRFKHGAFRPGVPVQPIILRYSSVNYSPSFPRYARKADGGLEDFAGMYAFLRGYFQFAQFLDVEYLPTYYPSQEERDNPHLYTENVQNLMAQHLNVPVVDYAYY
eukprot:752313_1